MEKSFYNKTSKKRISGDVCYFCVNAISTISDKEVELLRRFISAYARILPRRITGTCAKHQRRIAKAIKNSRIIGLLPFVLEK